MMYAQSSVLIVGILLASMLFAIEALKGKIVATAKGQTKFGSGQGKYTGKVKMDAI